MRKETIFTATEGRDKGKMFKLVESPAAVADEWALELIFEMMNAGVELPDDIQEMGMAGVAMVGFSSIGKIPYSKAKPLVEMLLSCVSFIPEPNDSKTVRKLFPEDIEEVVTFYQLRKAVFSLHTGFFADAVQ